MRTILVAVLLWPTLVGCRTLSSSAAGGQEQDAPFSLSLLETQACPLPPGADPKDTRIVGLRVRIEAAHPGRVGANYFYGSLLTKDGDRYLAELAGCEPVLAKSPLSPGESAEGFLNFPLPIDETPDKVVYAPSLDHTRGSDLLSTRDLSQELSVE